MENLAAMANITTKPVINTLGLDSNGNYRRDEALTISGVALNTARRIEIVHADGSELAPRMYLDLPYPGVSVDENGGRIQISKNSFFTSQADGHGPDSKRKFKITNAISDTDDNNTFNVIDAQLSILPKDTINGLTIAYEPVWSIGSGDLPSNEYIEDVLSYIKNKLKSLYSDEIVDRINLLYGGSVDKDSVNRLLEVQLIDGFLIGSASADFESFKAIAEKLN